MHRDTCLHGLRTPTTTAFPVVLAATNPLPVVLSATKPLPLSLLPHTPYYAPGPDVIQLPVPEAFRDAESYAATKAHEVTHWTKVFE